ncbi:dTDP-glucose 4,6-dehydratase [Thermodesulfovibrio sp. 1176]|uniref:dTDP-glucose 4,6-dehydratase n=1 Tax=Thermodesulfovibrio sp. 1176 TaxID=3043424 RepID=UPI0024825533|nr:dTDP-glucose 4,6-dehydratase [Thermodesulfovibrio sp. 1176]MDI1471511.1 dTDP-glucose 4,6-dehydratase [Thermodesulfovibrio sp. 1176]
MKLLVTGGAGFIGSEFVKQAVLSGYAVAVIDVLTYAGDIERLKNVEGSYRFYKVDITNKPALEEVFKKEKPEVVVHFAAESHVDRSILEPNIFIKTNIEGTLNLLDLSRKYGIQRFINISTDEVYGELDEEGKFTESSPLMPNSPYSVSKAGQDMLGRAYMRTYGLPVITVRPSNNYGPWQYPEKLIPVVIVKAIKNEPIPVYGDGKNIRQWLYVEDCASAVMKVMEKGRDGEIYNVPGSEELRNIQIVETIIEILHKPKELIKFVQDRPGHDYRYAMDSDKIEKLGWYPKTKFKDGIRETINWYINNLTWVENKMDYLSKFWAKVYK